jgi:hypothetical protein
MISRKEAKCKEDRYFRLQVSVTNDLFIIGAKSHFFWSPLNYYQTLSNNTLSKTHFFPNEDQM